MLEEPFYCQEGLLDSLVDWLPHCSFEQNSHILKSRFSSIYTNEGEQSNSFTNPGIL